LCGEVGVQTKEAAVQAAQASKQGMQLLGVKGPAVYAIYAAGGVVVGLFSGLFGVGGGILMVPFLVVVAGFAQQQANAISLSAMILAAASGAFTYFRGKTLTPPMLLVALALGLGAIPGARLGATIAQDLNKTTLSALFALFIVVVAVRIMPAEGARSLHLPFAGLVPSMLILLGVLALAVGVRLALSH
jgi:uncharacterized membrane protein YfcA